MCFVPPSLQPSHPIPRLGLVCTFKKNLLHLQSMNHREILMPITPTGLNVMMNLLALMLLLNLERDLPTTLQDQWKCSIHKLMTSPFPFMTLVDLPILLIPKAQITMQGLSTSTFYHGPKLSELLDHIFAGYVFLCIIDAHAKTPLLGFHKVTLDSGQSVQKSFKPSFGWHTPPLLSLVQALFTTCATVPSDTQT